MSNSLGQQNTVQVFSEDSVSGNPVPNKSISGVALTRDKIIDLLQGLTDGSGTPKTSLSDILPVIYLNLGVAATPGTPATTELTELDLTLANHSGKTVAATGIVITAAGYGNFMGFHFTYNQASKVSAATALTIAATPINAEAWGAADHKQSYFVANGQSLYVPLNQTLGLIHLIALGAATNTLHLAPV